MAARFLRSVDADRSLRLVPRAAEPDKGTGPLGGLGIEWLRHDGYATGPRPEMRDPAWQAGSHAAMEPLSDLARWLGEETAGPGPSDWRSSLISRRSTVSPASLSLHS
jgi:hypothetical protein